MPYWQCYYHVVWGTKGRQPMITPQREPLIFDTIRQVTEEVGGHVWAVNGIVNHVHVAVSIPPRLSVAVWVKRCKGASSRYVNQASAPDNPFKWQAGYGVFTFGKKALRWVVAYIDNQKHHHADGTTHPDLETME